MNATSLKQTPTPLLIPIALTLLLMTGCTVGPKYVRPQLPGPPAYRGGDDTPVSSADQNSLGDENWAQVFNEPELQELIRTALVNNYDVRIAAQHVLEARTWGVELWVQLPVDSRVARSLMGASICPLPGTLTSGVCIAARLRHKELKCFRRCGPSAPSA